ncbi:putative DNA modification/repair radical SAM protein [Teredinibacter turnerae]|uniref:putative DNA modification/repair radical SAM protein n=1 Tax=Teredinibacter turnerae TaxID=2426 RepID=UPI0030CFD153
MNLPTKLSVLADAAKYDASCASSGSVKRNSVGGKGIGSTSGGMGICHSYAPDGRCISLLKILLTNFCIYECSYCVNRASSSVKRARFSVDEVVNLTLDFYKRNYIEGLFLSSGIIQSSDYTMEQLVNVARTLRKVHDFRGYIHLKTIPDASPELLQEAGLYADRLSINIELPSKQALTLYAPEKNPATIHRSMGQLRHHIDESKESRQQASKIISSTKRKPSKPSRFIYSPAGQSTQMIVGADASSDSKILTLSNYLYGKYQMRRVYYSAFSPIPDAAQMLPAKAPTLVREHRLYQADWLLRFYGFTVDEISQPNDERGGMLDLDIDPKLSWAIRNRDFFPVNINHAPKEALLRVPGIGAIGAKKVMQSRQFRRLRFGDLAKCGLSVKKVAPFIEAVDYRPDARLLESEHLKTHFVERSSPQIALF